MKSAYELLLDAPDSQITRLQIVFREIAAGRWAEAAHHLRNAVKEEGATDWACEAEQLATACERQVNPFRLVAASSATAAAWDR